MTSQNITSVMVEQSVKFNLNNRLKNWFGYIQVEETTNAQKFNFVTSSNNKIGEGQIHPAQDRLSKHGKYKALF